MGKQPYIPIYIGDYLKDTRVLPLAVRGAWVDLILFMWDSPVRGEIVATVQEIARMIGCDTSEAEFALNLLKQKNTANIDLLPSGEYKIVSRRMKKDAEISKIRSEVGKKGVKAKLAGDFAEPKQQAKVKQNTDIEYESNIVLDNKESIQIFGTKGNFIVVEKEFIYDKLTKVFEDGMKEYMESKLSVLNYPHLLTKFMKQNNGRHFDDFKYLYSSYNKFTDNA